MEPGRAAAKEVKMLAVVEGDARPEAVGGDGGAGEEKKTADGARKTAVETSVIGSPAVGPLVAATADVDGDESATGKGDAGDAAADGAAAVTVVADLVDQAEPSAALKVVADLIGAEASGDVCEVKDDMQMEAGEGSRKRKREEEDHVPPPIQELEPVPPPIQEEEEPVPAPALPAPPVPAPPVPALYEELEDSDGSLEYDSQDSSESVDSRNIGSFKTKLLQKLEAGSSLSRRGGGDDA
ncbi:uncharacterized protein [Lolium perenne]|uniref:uncharacterized protein n=1 Tax=Lolium perenne TaxID=4522 RepID=UPI003A99A2E3